MGKARVRKKYEIDANVYDKALERIRYCFKIFDKVVVSFSGGKDSTAVLNLTLKVAEEIGYGPVDVVFCDEEAIHPTTIDYVGRVAKRPDVNIKWLCLEIKHRNACSSEEPFWFTWDKDKEDLWVREMPKEAIHEHPKFKKGMLFPDFTPHFYDKSEGNVCWLTGVRSEESLRRYRMVARKKNDNYITTLANHKHVSMAHPIYDWGSVDVWIAVRKFDWDYNRTYDIFDKTKLNGRYLTQRVCPPFGEEPLRGLWVYVECFPELWHKMLNRVPGVNTAWRYSNTELYGQNGQTKPEDITWKDYLDVVLQTYEPKAANQVKANVKQLVVEHYGKTKEAIPDEEPHPLSGASYKFLCKCAKKGGFKNRQQQQMLNEAAKTRKKLGISHEEAIQVYGHEKYKYEAQKAANRQRVDPEKECEECHFMQQHVDELNDEIGKLRQCEIIPQNLNELEKAAILKEAFDKFTIHQLEEIFSKQVG